jgi:hypothetical protein
MIGKTEKNGRSNLKWIKEMKINNAFIRLGIILVILGVCFHYTPLEKSSVLNILTFVFIGISLVLEIRKLLETKNKIASLILRFKSIYPKLFLLIVLFATILYMPTICSYGKIRYARLFLIFFAMLFIGLITRDLFRSISKNYLKNTILVFTSGFIILLLIESTFMFVSYPFGSGEAYAGKLFNYKYWNPINKEGFRDKEFKKNEKTILFLGDSYTAGWGIKKVENRFSEIAFKNLNLSKNYTFYNIGQYGADSKIEYENLKRLVNKYNPNSKHLVLQVLYNDIDPYLPLPKKECEKLNTIDESRTYKLIVNGSYLMNLLNSFYPSKSNQKTNQKLTKECSYEERLRIGYNDSTYYNKMFKYHDSIITFCKSRNIKPIVVYFPLMEDLKFDKKFNIDTRFEKYFNSKNIDFINIKNHITHLNRDQRQASKMDAHASEIVHEIAGKLIAKKINSYGNH